MNNSKKELMIYILKNINIENFQNINLNNKNILVNMVDMGLLKYTKLTPKNYNYWWYEVDVSKTKINKKKFTANLNDFKVTRKGRLLILFSKLTYFQKRNLNDLYNFTMQFINNELYDGQLDNVVNEQPRQLQLL